MYEELVARLKEKGERFDYDGWVDTAVVMEKAADAVEELSKLANAIPHVCECCVGCELEKKNGGCDHAFVPSPKRAMQYLSKPRWIPVTERLPLYGQDVLAVRTYGDGEKCQEVLMAHIAVWNEETGAKWWNATNITHWMPLPEPPKEEI